MKKKISILIISLIIVLASLGLSYAYWKITLMGDKGNNVTSGCFNIEMINQKDEITLGSTFPITDSEGLKLKPFSFTLKNTCTIFAHYYVNMEMLEGTTLNSKFVAVRVNNEAINTLDTYNVANTTINTSTESRTIAEGYLGADEEVDYTVSFWMDEDATINDDVMNKVFKSKIVINSEPGKYDPVSAGYDTLHDAILANEYYADIDKAKRNISLKQTPDFSSAAPIIDWKEQAPSDIVEDKVIKIASSDIGIDYETSSLTNDDSLLRIFKKKSLNQTTGQFYLTDMIISDPTTLDYANNDYFFNIEYIEKTDVSKKFHNTFSNLEPSTAKIISATKKEEKNVIYGTEYNTVVYTLKLQKIRATATEQKKSEKGLYESTDDFGTTYYYRGNVKNNYIKFAGLYWRIVRINGDGSIKLLYDGKTPDSKENIEFTNYQNLPITNPVSLSYMYGNDISTKENALKNEQDSNLKKTLDSWYEENILNKGYKKFTGGGGFCNDRSTVSGDGFSTKEETIYSSMNRINNNNPILICQNTSRDLYTTTDSSIGNKALTYPIGVLTYDELAYSGADNAANNIFAYTYTGYNYFTMTPYLFDGAAMTIINYSQGYLIGSSLSFNSNIRPVINLKSDVKITGGTGTANDPFVVDTNN